MKFNKIDMTAWKRAKTFEHFTNEIPCTYSMTVNIDASNLRTRSQVLPLVSVLSRRRSERA